MSLEDRVETLETDMDDVKTLLASAARHAENAAAVAEQNAIAIRDHRQDSQFLETRMDCLDQRLDEHITNSEATRQRLDEYSANNEATRQRLDSFVVESQRVRTDHGERLSRIEAGLETLVNMAQNHERRLTAREDRALEMDDRMVQVESSLETLVVMMQASEERLTSMEDKGAQIDDRLDRITLNLEAIADGLRSFGAGVDRLEARMDAHLQTDHQQEDGS